MLERVTDVAVGVIVRADGKILLGSRPEGKPWAGWWELPGGKIEPGETVSQALVRELEEEIDIKVTSLRPWVTHIHRYPNNTVRLHFWRVTAWEREPVAQESQALQWVDISTALERKDLLPATYPPLRWLQVPDRYLISNVGGPQGMPGFMALLTRAIEQGISLVQWREPGWQQKSGSDSVLRGLNEALSLCRSAGVRLLVNSVHPAPWWSMADGVHLRASDAMALDARPALPEGHWVGVSTHSPLELEHARTIAADFAVLGPVLATQSHPDGTPLGWETFEAWREAAGLPVFAIGGQSTASYQTALSRGAHGIAGIRQLID